MTGVEIITKFENMVQDSLDSDFAYQLLNDAKDEVEAMQAWFILTKETSFSISSGYSFSSAAGSLPTRFALDISVSDGSNLPYAKVDFTDRYSKENASYGYFIDLANDNFHLAGSNHSAKTIYLYYTDYSADITSTGTWSFPDRFHSILPLKMAELYYPADAGERSRSWDDRWAIQYERALARMYAWNDQLKVNNRRSRRLGTGDNPRGLNV